MTKKIKKSESKRANFLSDWQFCLFFSAFLYPIKPIGRVKKLVFSSVFHAKKAFVTKF
jgi:hypothetical protein